MKNFNKILQNNKSFILLIFSLIIVVSCEDYLEDELLSETSVDFLYNTPEGLESAVVGLYALNRTIYNNTTISNNGLAIVPVAKSDLVVGRAGEPAFFARLGWGIDQTRYGTRRLDQFWQHYYRLIDRANAIIKYAPDVNFDDPEEKQRIIAEAKVFRAHSYFTLYRQFNNIFITTEPTTPDNAFDKPQDKSSPQEIFALINSDLDTAIMDLDWTTEQFGRFTQASARHLKAKVAMWEENWSEAASQAEAVINEGSYSLVEDTDIVFEGDMNHSESLWVVQYEQNVVGGGNGYQINFLFVPQYHQVDGVTFSIDNGGRGTGSLLMNDYLRNLLAEDPNDDRDDGSYYISYYRYNDAENLPEGVQLGDTVDVYNQFSNSSSQRNQYYRTMNPSCIKYRDENTDPSQAGGFSNIMVYRLAETYLIAAEAYMRLGNSTKALEYLNAIRTRANASSLTEIDQQTILDERARELAFEGQRFYTLKRMGVYVSQIQQYAGNDNFFPLARERVEPHYVNWPIPIAELNLLGPNYPQNDGYPE